MLDSSKNYICAILSSRQKKDRKTLNKNFLIVMCLYELRNWKKSENHHKQFEK